MHVWGAMWKLERGRKKPTVLLLEEMKEWKIAAGHALMSPNRVFKKGARGTEAIKKIVHVCACVCICVLSIILL